MPRLRDLHGLPSQNAVTVDNGLRDVHRARVRPDPRHDLPDSPGGVFPLRPYDLPRFARWRLPSSTIPELEAKIGRNYTEAAETGYDSLIWRKATLDLANKNPEDLCEDLKPSNNMVRCWSNLQPWRLEVDSPQFSRSCSIEPCNKTGRKLVVFFGSGMG